jgi:pimeloyl-ACP methyl ester carboxylesterase
MAALDHFGVDRFVLAAWSNGTRIGIEIAARYPERVAALVLISGGYGHPAGRLLRLEIASALPVVASVAKYFAGPLAGRFQRLVARPEITGLVRQSGMVGATADTPALVDLLRGMADCDLKTLLRTFEAVVGDSGAELLPQIQSPTLVIVGERDQFTTGRMIDELAHTIPNCEVVHYEGATHYLPLEYPARLSDDLRRFFETRT